MRVSSNVGTDKYILYFHRHLVEWVNYVVYLLCGAACVGLVIGYWTSLMDTFPLKVQLVDALPGADVSALLWFLFEWS